MSRSLEKEITIHPRVDPLAQSLGGGDKHPLASEFITEARRLENEIGDTEITPEEELYLYEQILDPSQTAVLISFLPDQDFQFTVAYRDSPDATSPLMVVMRQIKHRFVDVERVYTVDITVNTVVDDRPKTLVTRLISVFYSSPIPFSNKLCAKWNTRTEDLAHAKYYLTPNTERGTTLLVGKALKALDNRLQMLLAEMPGTPEAIGNRENDLKHMPHITKSDLKRLRDFTEPLNALGNILDKNYI